MEFVVTRRQKREGLPDDVFYYAGYQCESWSNSGPIFNRTVTPNAVFTEEVADMAVKQLTQMGHEVQKEPRYKRPSRAQAS